jgi:hypothetical protein
MFRKLHETPPDHRGFLWSCQIPRRGARLLRDGSVALVIRWRHLGDRRAVPLKISSEEFLGQSNRTMTPETLAFCGEGYDASRGLRIGFCR